MNANLKAIKDKRVERTINSLVKNNINAQYFPTKEGLLDFLKGELSDGLVVSVGGSMTLFEIGVIEHLRCGRYMFLDRHKEGITPEELREIYLKSFDADAYFASSNAVTEDGYLYNVDGNGNRVASIMYGPKKVYLVVGTNKIVKNIDAAIQRNKSVSGPANCMRLSIDAPCKFTGECIECNSPNRICCMYTVLGYQRVKGRINVLFVEGEFGF